MPCWNDFKNILEEHIPLAERTFVGVGGACRWFARPRSPSEANDLFSFAHEQGLPVRLLGGGSNLWVADQPFEGLVVTAPSPADLAIQQEGNRLIAPAGLSLAALLAQAQRLGLSGLEFLCGIPGTLGGAVRMNAGGSEHWIGEQVHDVTSVCLQGGVKTWSAEEVFFGYRSSNLVDQLVTEVTLELSADDPEKIAERMAGARQRKQATQPLGLRSAGCTFKNPPGASAGALIDQADCKGLSEGAAQVSDIHANFFINHGNATFQQLWTLAERVRERVQAVHGMNLELEVKLWKSNR